MGLAGYRLHLKRLGFPQSGESIRTMKYQLGNTLVKASENNANSSTLRHTNFKGSLHFRRSQLEDEVANGIQRDYEKLYGAFNFATYYKENNIYSLKEFWLDLLRAGAILKHTQAKMLSDLRILSGDEERLDRQQQQLMQDANSEFLKLIDFNKFKSEVLLSEGFRKNKRALSFFKDPKHWRSQQLIKEVTDHTIGYSYEHQDKFWQSYGVNKTLYDVAADTQTTTFYLLPQISFEDNLAIQDPAELIESTGNCFKKLFNITDLKLEKYIGLSDSAGGLSEIFSKYFELLLDRDFNAIKQVFNGMSDLWQGKDEELDNRLTFLAERAQKIGKPVMVNSWKDYRTDFGGKIQSWLSNSIRQDGKLAQSLFGDVIKDYKPKGKYEYKYKNTSAKLIPADIRSGGHKHELQKIIDFQLKDEGLLINDDINNLLQECREIATRLKGYVEKFEISFNNDSGFDFSFKTLEIYRDDLASLRICLNQLHQPSNYDKNLRKKVKNTSRYKPFVWADKRYPALFKELERTPSFIGYAKTSEGGVYDKYLQSLPRLKIAREFIDSQLRGCSLRLPVNDNHNYLKAIKNGLQQVLEQYKLIQSSKGVGRSAGSTIVSNQILAKILKSFLDCGLDEIRDQHYIYQSPYKRRQLSENNRLNLRFEGYDLEEQVPLLLQLMEVDWLKYDNATLYLNEWVVFIEIEKIRLGLLARTYDLSKIIFNDELKTHFPLIDIILQRSSNQLDSAHINTVIQQAIFSEMRGTISKMTTKSMIARYVIQPIDSEKKFKLVTQQSKYRDIRNKQQGYYLCCDSLTAEGGLDLGDDNQNFHVFNGKKINVNLLKNNSKIQASSLIKLNSSKYQLQFLDNALSGAWQEHQPTYSSYSLIYERQFDVSWSANSNQPILKEADNYKLFLSVPFSVSGKESKETQPADFGNKFLGIDIGEYGLATYLLDIKTYSGKVLDFIDDKPLRKIRFGVADNKHRQKAGTFSIPNSYVKRLREQAITSLRNKMHTLAVTNKAIPVYESSISNFETGSGRISKIYRSLKLSDTFDGSGVSKLESNLIWGKRKGKLSSIAKEISAYATSYSCSHCCRSLFALDLDSEYRVSEVVNTYGRDTVVKMHDCNDGDVILGLVKNKRIQAGEILKLDDVKKYARDYARPPYHFLNLSLAHEVVNHHYAKLPLEFMKQSFADADKVTDGDKIALILQYYAGSQAIFRCPFSDCGKIADADAQAALWIALKGYVKYLVSIYQKKDKYRNKLSNDEESVLQEIYGTLSNLKENDFKFMSLEPFLKWVKSLRIQPINFEFQRRFPKS